MTLTRTTFTLSLAALTAGATLALPAVGTAQATTALPRTAQVLAADPGDPDEPIDCSEGSPISSEAELCAAPDESPDRLATPASTGEAASRARTVGTYAAAGSAKCRWRIHHRFRWYAEGSVLHRLIGSNLKCVNGQWVDA
ncbi:hypothetical protein ACQEU3_44990 [Spirillospora sp. CA-253888]